MHNERDVAASYTATRVLRPSQAGKDYKTRYVCYTISSTVYFD